MAVIKFDKILSVNSETQNHEAKHLLRSEVSLDRSWLCEKGTEKGIVILKLERAAVLSKLDVGNAHSAFIEILVGRAADSSDQFQTLVPTSTFMTPNESKASVNKNQVRFFTTADFDPSAVGRQWDLLKIVCSQPFDRHVPFGICFVKVHGEAALTILPLKGPEEQSITAGSFFRKRKEEENDRTPSINERIRLAEKPEALAKHSPLSASKVSVRPSFKLDKQRRSEDNTTPDNRKNRNLGLDEPSSKRSKKDECTSKDTLQFYKEKKVTNLARDLNSESDEDSVNQTEERKKEAKRKEKEINKKEEEEIKRKEMDKNKKCKPREREHRKTHNEEERRKPEVSQQESVKEKSKRKQKPFNKLLEGVVFVLSGFQNPERGTYRSHAIAMGARYSQDWQDGRCTHLIAAFHNTPKCNQVRGKGKIVNKDWVEKCYNDKKRYPWRRFALDKNEKQQPESEDEIHLDSSSPPRLELSSPISSHSSSTLGVKLKNNEEPDSPSYNASTDDDDESEPILKLPNFFSGMIFYVDGNIADRDVLERYIIAYDGTVRDSIDGSVTYFVTCQRGSVLDHLKKKFKNLLPVSPTWIQAVNCSKAFISPNNFLV